MSSGRLFALSGALACGAWGCLSPWDVGGPWHCSDAGTCPGKQNVCDDGVCCNPDGLPACPTLPATNGTCREGDAGLYFQDADHDGYGNPKVATRRCRTPSTGGWVADGTDCDDADPAIHPGGAEAGNGKDDNCNGEVDENLTPRTTFYLDGDFDGFGQDDAGLEACAAPPGYVARGGDCAPFDPTKFPGAPELCDGLDDNCNGLGDAQETSFVDVDSPAHPFPCVSSGLGVCQAGVFTCQLLTDGGVQRKCVSVRDAGRELCDGLDNDCNGFVDEAPACGGPKDLTNLPGATYFAGQVTNLGFLSTQCQKGLTGASVETATAGGLWSGSTAGFHLWYVEAPPGQVWDLSNPDAALRIAFSATGTGASATRGLWGDPMGTQQDSVNPVVYLCGEDVTQVMRYRISDRDAGLKFSETGLDRTLLLKGVGSGWIIGQGSGFDTTRVTRIELVLQTTGSTFSLSLKPDAGFSR